MSTDSESEDLYGNITSKLQNIKNAFYQEETASSGLLVDSVDISFDESVIDEQGLKEKSTRQTRSQTKKKCIKSAIDIELNISDESETSELPETSMTSKKRNANSMPKKRLTRSNTRTEQPSAPQPKKAKLSKKKNDVNANKSKPKGRARKKKSTNNHNNLQSCQQDILQSNTESNIPIINIGVHEGYHDFNESQAIFKKSAIKTSVPIVIDDSDSDESIIEQNPEVPVTVFWKSIEYVKFSLRKFQKLSLLYEHFAKKENVPKENILFSYNDKVLSADDSVDSINYRVVQYLEGGVVSYNVSEFLRRQSVSSKPSASIPGGITLKFQCQQRKRPYEATLAPNEKLNIAMVKFAEHIEKPIKKLKFYFDGDILEPNATPSQVDMEGGECIDVKVVD